MKKLTLVLTYLLLCIAAVGQIPTTNLIGEYKFTNSRLDDAIGDDDLTQVGSALVFENNRAAGPTKAANLNGDYLQRAGEGHTDVTVSFWVKTVTNDVNKKVIIDQSERAGEAEGSAETGWYAYLQDGKIKVAANYQWYHSNNTAIGALGYSGYHYVEGISDISDGNWHHVAITIDSYWGNWVNVQYQRTDRIIRNIYKIYVDGALEASHEQTKNVGSATHPNMRRFFNAAVPITIGNSKAGNSTNRFTESVDDIRYYQRAIDAAEVGQLAGEVACSGTSGVTAAAQDITIQLDATGNATITTDDIDDGSAAVCDEPFTLSLDKTAFTCDDLGFNVVTLTAVETFGTQATATATATVTVAYTPVVTTQNITVQLDASGSATIVSDDVNDGSETTGVCSAALTFSLDKTDFTCADLGANVVTLTSSDGNGNSGSATATVTVEDNVAPVVITQDVTAMVNASLGFVTISTAQVDNGSTDNCDTGSLVFSLSKTKFTCEDTGDNIVTLTVEDTNGNISSADATVTITSEINDETITATNTNMCPDGSMGSTISTGSSVVGFNYTLRKSSDNSVIDGPIAGTGSALDFVTGNLSETTSFNVIAEKALTLTQTALDFDGVNDYVSLGTDNRGITTQVTVAAWIKTTASGAAQIINNKYDGVNGYHIIIDEDGYTYIGGRDGAGYKQSGNSTTTVNDGEWHYLTGSINISTGVWGIYVDGILENSTSNGAGTTLASPAALTVGAYSTLYFTGEMDQVTIWDTALDAASIATNMNTCLVGNETNIVGHYIFEDGSGTALTDQSTSALDGTLTNMDGATDWIQVVSPSCGDKTCDYQLSTEITIGDAVDPTAIAQDITVQLDAITGEVTISADDIDNGSSDNCTSALTKSISKSTFDCGDVGDHVVELTIEDESGNVSTAQSTVSVTSLFIDQTVVATSSPNFCPDGSISTISTSSSQVGLDYYLRDSQDNEIKDGPIAGTGNPLDFSTGNISSTTTFNVYAQLPSEDHSALDFDGVDDKIVTTYIPPATSTLTLELWMKPTLTAYSRVISSYQGSASVPSGEVVLDTYDAANTGTSLRFVVSGAGNTQFLYSVPNVLTLNEWNHVAAVFDNGVIRLYVDGALVGTSAAATFTSLPLSSSAVAIGEDRVQGPNAEYFEGQMDEIRIWNTARTANEIASGKNQCMEGDETGLGFYLKLNENSGLVATDLVGGMDGTLTNMDTGSDWITSGVDIDCGAVCGFQMSTEVTLGDTEAPIAVAQNLTVQLDASGNATAIPSEVDNGSSDNCTSAESLVFSLDKTDFNCADIGVNAVTFTTEDASGNQSTAAVTITVLDEVAPTIIVQNITVELDAQGSASITAADIDNGTSDNCTALETLIMDLDKLSFTCADLGVNTVLLIVEDESGNQSSTNVTVTVTDIIEPTLVTKNATLSLDPTGNVTIDAVDVTTSVSDNCTTTGNFTFSLSQSVFSCADIGQHTIDVTVTDGSNNSVTETATVTIVDDEAPMAIAQNIIVSLNENNSVTISAADINNGSTDNCGNMTMSLDKTSFNESDLGENIVTLTVTDGANNSSAATATVTVEPNKLDQTITFSALADKVYGDANFTLSASTDSGLPISFSIVSGPASLSGNTVSISGAGEVVINANQTGDDEYFAAVLVEQSFTVIQATLTVTADNKSIAYGESIPELTFTYAGFVNGDTESNLAEVPTISTDASTNSDAGTYDILLSTGGGVLLSAVSNPVADNYALNLVNGTLTIEKTSQEITFESLSDRFADSESFNLSATATSDLAVTFSVAGPASINGNVLSLGGSTGVVTITASQSGNINYNAASDVSVSFNVFAPCSSLQASLEASGSNLEITALGGTSPYEYSLDGTTFQAASNFNNLPSGTYTVTVRDVNGCSVVSNSTTIEVTGIPDRVAYSFYPNPVQDQLRTENIQSVIIYDLSGHVVINTSGGSSIDVRNLKSGIYLMKATTFDGETVTERIVKN